MGSENNSTELLKLRNQIWSFKDSACLKCAVQLGIPDAVHTHGKPMTLSELTAALPINPFKAPYIYRLMRVLVNNGLFVEKENGYALSSTGRLLVKGDPLNVSSFALMTLDPLLLNPWLSLSDWFANDDASPFETAHGEIFWNHFGKEPKLQKLFDAAMAGESELIAKVLIDNHGFVFEGLESMVDVGGGTGTVARAIAKAFPGLKCSVLDLPRVVADLQGTENLEFVGGDMFEEVPQANAILLKLVLHDWSDEECNKILKNCKKAISNKEKGGKLVVIDTVLGDEESSDSDTVEGQISSDMMMLVLHNGKERTEKDWSTLFKNAGFNSYKAFPLVGLQYLIEVYP